MPRKVDNRHRNVGGDHRALSRYYMIVNRLKTTHRKKSAGYYGVEIRVSKEDFVEWFKARDFYGCSVDRIDNKGHYELANMQIIPMWVNNGKDKIIAKDGKTRCFVCGETKPLDEFVRDKRRLLTGRTTICKACEAVRSRSRKAKAMNKSTTKDDA